MKPRRARVSACSSPRSLPSFLVEMGDKTQIATVALAAQFHSLVLVVLGTTLGMLLVNVPVVFAGDALMRYVPLKVVRVIAALSFAVLGGYVLLFA